MDILTDDEAGRQAGRAMMPGLSVRKRNEAMSVIMADRFALLVEISRLKGRVEELENEIRRLCAIVDGDENSRLWAWAAKQRCSGSKFIPAPSKPWSDSEYEYRCGKCLPCEARAKEVKGQNESPRQEDPRGCRGM